MKQRGLAPLVIIILIALAVGGYLLYQKQLKPAVISQPSPTPTPVASDQFADWKTYTNAQAGFQIRYPSFYQLIKEDSNSASFGFKDTVGNGPFEYLVITKDLLIDYRSLVVCTNTTNNPDIVADKLPCLTENISDANIDGIPAKSLYFTQGVDSNFHVVQTTTKPFIQAKMNVSGGGLERDFNKILSTFKFLDQNQISSISPDGSYIVTEQTVGDKQNITIKDKQGNIIVGDLITNNEKEIGYNVKFKCMCGTSFKKWINNSAFSIRIVNGGGEEYEYLVDAKTGKVNESSFKRVK